MLTGLSIRDIVLVEALDLEFGPGLTVLTGETGAGKSIILDALGLATGARADAGLVRAGAASGSATAVFTLAAEHPAQALLDEAGVTVEPGEDLILRRVQGGDGRSRAFVNDQPVGVAVLRRLGESLIEVHGQHETTGLLDARNHRPMLDDWAGLGAKVRTVRDVHVIFAQARRTLADLEAQAERAAGEAELLNERLAELDRLDPREGEETELAGERAVLGAAEKALSDLEEARQLMGADSLSHKLASAFRAIERARGRAVQAGASDDHPVMVLLARAGEAVDRTLSEAQEALDAVDAAAQGFDYEADRLDRVEERLFDLRAAARKLGVTVDALPAERARMAAEVALAEDGAEALKAARARLEEVERQWRAASEALSEARKDAAVRLAEGVQAELAPLKLERARFRVVVETLDWDKAGPEGRDRVVFEVQTNPGASWGGLAQIASGGELARFALALKASLARGAGSTQPVMIFDEVDQGVGGAVADAVGQRLAALAQGAQVMVVTHSPQVAARGSAHFKVSKADTADGVRTRLDMLDPARREEELARMLSGREVTQAARAAARALLG